MASESPSSIYAGAALRNPNADPPAELRRTFFGDLAQIIRDMIASTDLIHQLTLRDIRIRYKQAVFGFAWAILIPGVVILAGMAVRYAMAEMTGKPLNTAQIAGMAVKAVPWGFFVGCITAATPSLLSNIVLVTKVYFPREVLPLSAVLAQSFDSAIGLGIVAVLLVLMGVSASLQLLWVPVLLVFLWTFSLAAGLFLSCANIFFRDVKYLVQVFLTFGIFVTPVFLDANMFGHRGYFIVMLNPLAPILEGLRLSVVEHHNLFRPFTAPQGFVFWHPWYLLYTGVWSVAGLALSAVFFHRSERRFAELA